MKKKYKSMSKIRPRGGKRGCLCKDRKTYHPKCCTGEMHAQGIGKIQKKYDRFWTPQTLIIYNTLIFMKATEILNEIKNVLGIELSEESVALAVMKLENGTEIESESFEVGKDVFIKNEDGDSIPLPVGDYTLEDGTLLSVKEEGKIAEMKKKEEESSQPKEDLDEHKDDEEKMKKYATKEELSALKKDIEDIKNMIKDKDKLSEQEEGKSDENQEVVVEAEKVEAEKVEPIAHNPEALSSQKNESSFYQSEQMARIRNMIYKK